MKVGKLTFYYQPLTAIFTVGFNVGTYGVSLELGRCRVGFYW